MKELSAVMTGWAPTHQAVCHRSLPGVSCIVGCSCSLPAFFQLIEDFESVTDPVSERKHLSWLSPHRKTVSVLPLDNLTEEFL